MNDYLVQYATVTSRVHEWTEADSPLDAAANVLIDKGFDPTFKNDLVIVVCKNNWQAGVYPVSDVRVRADIMLGLTPEPTPPEDPTAEADWWKG